jgi:hypothetical protein
MIFQSTRPRRTSRNKRDARRGYLVLLSPLLVLVALGTVGWIDQARQPDVPHWGTQQRCEDTFQRGHFVKDPQEPSGIRWVEERWVEVCR